MASALASMRGAEELKRDVAIAAQQASLRTQHEAAHTREPLEATRQERMAGRERRALAGQQVAQVSADLARLASVTQDRRGTVITLHADMMRHMMRMMR